MKNETPGIAACDPRSGWSSLDPGNSMITRNEQVVLAKGRGYADISPVAELILGSRELDVDVTVDIVPRA